MKPASSKTTPLETITKIFNDLFHGWEVYEAHYNPSWSMRHTSEDLSCIMSQPERTLSSPLIDFDVKAACHFIQEKALVAPSDRFKPLCAVVKGQGGGKTRQLVEISAHFLKNTPSIVALPNSRWKVEKRRLYQSDNWEMTLVMECVLRMVSVFYGKPFSRKLFLVFDDKSFRESVSSFSAGEILQGCVNHVMRVVKTVRPNANTFILMIDESLRLSERIIDMYPGVHEPYEVIRAPLLDESITEASHLALVKSSLTVAPTKRTESGRPIETYPGYNFLDPRKVSTEWFKIPNPDQATLYWIGAFSGSPRGLQLLYEYYCTLPPERRKINYSNFSNFFLLVLKHSKVIIQLIFQI